MRICFFSGDISKTGGTERVTIMLANKLIEKGYDVSILSFKNGVKSSFPFNKKINFYTLELEEKKGFFSRKIFPYIRLIRFFNREKIDIFINVDVLLCLYSLPVRFFTKAKIIAWEHFNYRFIGVKNRLRARKLAAKLADCIVVLTKADLKEYKSNLNLKAKIINIYNPTKKITAKSIKDNIVVASGRLTYQKNFQELLRIWKVVSKKFPHWKLIICGEGEDHDSLLKIIKDNEISNVLISGFIKDINKVYEKSQVMVMTSRYEGFPMVLLEGQSQGLPLIAYDCFTGPSEIIYNERNGYLIEYGNRNEFIKKFISILENKELRNMMSENALNDSQRFNIDLIVESWIKLFSDLT